MGFLLPNQSILTRGLVASSGTSFSSLLTGGLPVILGPLPPVPNRFERLPGDPTPPDKRRYTPAATDSDIATVIDASGRLVLPTAFGSVDLGDGYRLEFDPATLAGKITPAFARGVTGSLDEILNGNEVCYTGADCRLMIEVGDTRAGVPRLAKQLVEATTLSVSVHRVKSPAVAAGFANPRGYARGRRTIGGSLVMTKFTAEVLMRFLQSGVLRDKTKDTYYMKVDQLPPFNISILFSNESGYASYQRLLGVELVTDGSVYSMQDMLTEQMVSYVAADFTPLLPLTVSSFYQVNDPNDRTAKRERTVQDVWDSRRKTIAI